MRQKRIEKVFKRFFKYPNPIFCIVQGYFQHGNYLCEVASTKTIRDMRWCNCEFQLLNPLLIFEGLFVDDGLWITVLERVARNKYIHRTDLCSHINSTLELNSFINKLN